MTIDLTFDDHGEGKVDAIAKVLNDDGTPAKGVSVTFRKNNRDAGKSARCDDDGDATKELTLPVSVPCDITATVVNKRHITTTSTVTPEAKKRRPNTTTELIISILFLAVVGTASSMAGQAGMFFFGLFGAIGIMFLLSSDGEEFVERLQNNDWIFYTIRGIAIFAFLMFLVGLWVDPPELNPIKAIGNQLNDLVSTKLEDPWANERWNFKGFFDGWGRTALFFLFWMVIAYPVSFWDDWVAKARSGSEKKSHGILHWLFTRFVHEGVGEAIWNLFGRKH